MAMPDVALRKNRTQLLYRTCEQKHRQNRAGGPVASMPNRSYATPAFMIDPCPITFEDSLVRPKLEPAIGFSRSNLFANAKQVSTFKKISQLNHMLI
ncbi:hypothetical protein [Mesorhizobium sp.]|uniref:hypothetical protein n=1 Tax=Mesorhizobium sp. TaxID=1871066 RepID=UPI0025E370A4|nr:hypothetical protein [Mesorhizobium sp.]